jgi:hypothetical protein
MPYLIKHPDPEPIAEKSVVEEPVGQEEWDEDNHLAPKLKNLLLCHSGSGEISYGVLSLASMYNLVLYFQLRPKRPGTHRSLIVRSVSDEKKSFYNIDTRLRTSQQMKPK